MRKIIGAAAFVAMVFTALPASAQPNDPYDYPYCLQGHDYGLRDCVSSQATSSVRLRPGGHSRIVARILDLHTSDHRAADGLIRYGDRATCDARLDSLPAYSNARTDTVIE
jgi:hypothetical protein